MSNTPNLGRTQNSTKAGRKFAAGFKPPKEVTQAKFIEDFTKIKAEAIGDLSKLVELSMGENKWLLVYAKRLMEHPDCDPDMFLKAGNLVSRASSNINGLIASMWRMQKELHVPAPSEPLKSAPPGDFTENGG